MNPRVLKITPSGLPAITRRYVAAVERDQRARGVWIERTGPEDKSYEFDEGYPGDQYPNDGEYELAGE